MPGPIFDRQSIACPWSSCFGRCGPTGPDDPWTCYCDRLCRILRDCCPDAEHHCFSSTDFHVETIAMDFLKHFMECRDLNGFYSRFHDYSRHGLQPMFDIAVVTSCPGGTDKDLDYACRTENGNPLNALPVCHPQNEVVFFNIHCALCHGYDTKELITFEADITCVSHDFDDDITNVKDFWEKCLPLVKVFLPPKCLPSMKRQQCMSVTEGDDGGARCLAYRNPVTLGAARPIYRNQFCIPSAEIYPPLQCQVMRFDEYNTTIHPVIFSQFSMLLDTSGQLHVFPTTKLPLMRDGLFVAGDEETKSNGNLHHALDLISFAACVIIRIVTDLVNTSMYKWGASIATQYFTPLLWK